MQLELITQLVNFIIQDVADQYLNLVDHDVVCNEAVFFDEPDDQLFLIVVIRNEVERVLHVDGFLGSQLHAPKAAALLQILVMDYNLQSLEGEVNLGNYVGQLGVGPLLIQIENILISQNINEGFDFLLEYKILH